MVNQISIIVPVWNEEGNILPLVQRIHKTLSSRHIDYTIIFIDDYSTDKTFDQINTLSEHYPIKYALKHGKPGKAFSIIEGVRLATTEYVVMIDGDLQYPPEAIPRMLKLVPDAGVVIANRKTYKSSIIRRFGSRLNSYVFGKLLHGLPHDIQSGLKVFKKDIIRHINEQSISEWTLDLPLLYHARELGYVIKGVEIDFVVRKSGVSKVNFVKATYGIITNAIGLKLQSRHAYSVIDENEVGMKNAGMIFLRKKFITHTTLPHRESAITTLTRFQKIFLLIMGMIFLYGLLFQLKSTLIIFIAILSFLYFIDVLFNLYLILKSLYSPPEITVSDEEIAHINNSSLPIYSILCPLYKEAAVLPQFIQAIEALDWPKHRLDVQLLLEADDTKTIEAAQSMNLPSYIRITVIPDSLPKTKPKASNYGLSEAYGEYIVIFDAEDVPEPSQLKKAYLAFQESPDSVACLQAKLNYYNPHHNLLTRLFTAEYSLWFDVILTGLQSIDTSIPLGGTSNHFKTEILKELKGWDPFNVTEDCDLGARLFKHGYRTAMIDSTTLEEANSNVKNWLRQRSRWIKGYIQTYFVHMRKPGRFLQEYGVHSFIFQLVVGGKIAFIFINPILWLVTLAYFTLYQFVGPAIESLYPTVVFYLAVTSLVFGNFLCMYYYMIGCAKREHYSLVKYVFLVPFYWLLVSVAALRSLYQLILKPYYWEKTVHGLHLQKSSEKIVSKAVKPRISVSTLIKIPTFNIPIRLKFIGGASFLIMASFASNFLNFIYNSYLTRNVSLENFGLISLIGSFIYIAQVVFSAFGRTVTHKSAYFYGKYHIPIKKFWSSVRQKSLKIAIIVAGSWLIISPVLQVYFRTENLIPFILFTPVWIIGTLAAVDNGFLGGNLNFKNLALISLTEATSKLCISYFIVQFGFPQFAYVAIPLSMILAFLFGWRTAKNTPDNTDKVDDIKENYSLPRTFFFTSIITSLTSISYLSLDLLLAKHYLTPVQAGAYSILTLVGKMVYFLSSLVTQFLIPIISHDIGANKNSSVTFRKLFILLITINCISFFIFGIGGWFTVPLLWGSKALVIIPYLPLYVLAMILFSCSASIISYHQIQNDTVLPFIGFGLGLIELLGIVLVHSSILSIVIILFISSILLFGTVLILHKNSEILLNIHRNFIDFLGIFEDVPIATSLKPSKKRILIFNWRDCKHKWAGGAEVYIHELAKRWVAMGHEVTVFCGNDRKSTRYEVIDGVHIIRRGGFYFVYLWAFLYYEFKFKNHYDVIIDSENGLPFFTPLYVNGEKIFLLIHHVHQEIFRTNLKPPFSWIAMTLEHRVMPFVYRNIQVITVSPSSKADILDHQLTKTEPFIVYNGVNTDVYKPGVKSVHPLVLYTGRLKNYKSIHILLQAASILISKIPQISFVIAGDGEEKRNLEKLAKKLGISEKIQFLGKVTEEMKIDLYKKAWIFVNPSLMEGWGITSIEANACGTPVIASNVSGLRDSVHNPHSGLLVPYGNVNEFARCIELLIKDKKLRNTMSLEAIEWAKNYNWDKSAKEFLTLTTI